MVQNTYQNCVGSTLFVSGVLHMRGLFRLTPSRSAQVRLSLPRSIPTPKFSQVLPGSPRKLVISCDFVGVPGFPGRTWLLFSAIFWGFRDFLGEPGGYPGRTWVETVGDGPGRAARVSSGKSGWRVARYSDPQFLKPPPLACRFATL